MSKHENFGKTIRSMRKKSGMSMKELCGGICAESTMSRIENGVHFPHEDIVDKLADRLGEQNFYERYILGKKYENHKKRESIKQTLLSAAESGEVNNIEEHLIELKSLLGDSASEDMQFYLALQNIWYEMNGVSVENRTKKFVEIFEMTKNFPSEVESVRDVVNKLSLNDTDHILVNNIGISLINEGREMQGLKVLYGLYTMIYEKMPECAKKIKKLAVVSNNCCLACVKCGYINEAKLFCKYAKEYGVKLKDVDFIASAVLLEADILECEGRHEEAKMKRAYVNEMIKIISNATKLDSDVKYSKYHETGIAVL